MSALQNSGYTTQGHTEAQAGPGASCARVQTGTETQNPPQSWKKPQMRTQTHSPWWHSGRSLQVPAQLINNSYSFIMVNLWPEIPIPTSGAALKPSEMRCWRDEMKGLASALQPRGEDEQSSRSRSEQTSSKNILLPLFGL